jgi:hypothetical protein
MGRKLDFPGGPQGLGFYSRLAKVQMSVILTDYQQHVQDVTAEREMVLRQIVLRNSRRLLGRPIHPLGLVHSSWALARAAGKVKV